MSLTGITCAVAQVVTGSEMDGRASVSGSSGSEKPEEVMTVEPKGEHPPSTLRRVVWL